MFIGGNNNTQLFDLLLMRTRARTQREAKNVTFATYVDRTHYLPIAEPK